LEERGDKDRVFIFHVQGKKTFELSFLGRRKSFKQVGSGDSKELTRRYSEQNKM
jgi:hypothetical protein